MRLIDADALKEAMSYNGGCGICFRYVDDADTIDAEPVVRCRDCRHKRLDGPSTCKSIVNEFYCDEKLEWRYQYEGEPDILDWYCADGEKANDRATEDGR